MMNRLTYLVLSAMVCFASWHDRFPNPLTWSDGVF
jgi:hypothetical protein